MNLRSPTRLLAALALACAVLITGLGSFLPANADSIEWNVAPADEAGPDGRVSLRHVVEPGDLVQDAIAVTNTGDVSATFTISFGDGIVGTDGAFDIDDQSHDFPAPSLFRLSGDLRVTPLRVGSDEIDAPGAIMTEFSQPAVSWTGVALVLIVGTLVVGLILRARRPAR